MSRRPWRLRGRRWAVWAVALSLALAWAVPLLWVASSTLKPQHEIVGPERSWRVSATTARHIRTRSRPSGPTRSAGWR